MKILKSNVPKTLCLNWWYKSMHDVTSSPQASILCVTALKHCDRESRVLKNPSPKRHSS